MNVDKALEELGSWGRFQTQVICLICLPIAFTAMYGLSYVFTTSQPAHRCLIPECDTGAQPAYLEPWLSSAVPFTGNNTPSSCQRFPAVVNVTDNSCTSTDLFLTNTTMRCSRWVFEQSESTIASEFGIACSDEWKLAMVGTVNSIGQFIGLPIAGIISDRIGRKMILVISTTLISFAGFARSMSWNYYSFLFLEFLDPVVGCSIYSTCFVLGVELVCPDKRVYAAALLSMFYAVGEAILGALAMVVKDWRHLLMVVYCPSFVFVSYYCGVSASMPSSQLFRLAQADAAIS